MNLSPPCLTSHTMYCLNLAYFLKIVCLFTFCLLCYFFLEPSQSENRNVANVDKSDRFSLSHKSESKFLPSEVVLNKSKTDLFSSPHKRESKVLLNEVELNNLSTLVNESEIDKSDLFSKPHKSDLKILHGEVGSESITKQSSLLNKSESETLKKNPSQLRAQAKLNLEDEFGNFSSLEIKNEISETTKILPEEPYAIVLCILVMSNFCLTIIVAIFAISNFRKLKSAQSNETRV